MAGHLENRVRAVRLSKGLSQEEVARRAGVSRNTVVNVEREVTVPTILVALAIAAALGVAVTALFKLGGKGGGTS